MKESNLMDLLEFGRMIHAEMSAISDAARLGRALIGTTMYSTTFPCHMCARQIVAAGIERVVYLEPYPKSQAAELYPDSIEIEGESHLPGPKVRFEPFVGIAPERYQEIFTRGRRKDDDGRAILWEAHSAEPILQRLVPAYLTIEVGVIAQLSILAESVDLKLKKGEDDQAITT